LGAVFALCFAALTGCGGSSLQQPVSSGQSSERARAQTANSVVHLYVSDAGARAILRFVLRGGVPDATPDAVISGFSRPHGIAIGADGKLYAVDKGAQKVLIFAPSPNSNSKPIRTIAIGQSGGIGTVGVDPAGNTYVAYLKVCTTEGFTCGFTDVYSPYGSGSKYLKTLNFGGNPGGAVIRSMSFDSSGRLVEATGRQGPDVYSDALDGGTPYPIFCGAESDSGNVWGAKTNELIETDLGNPYAPQIVVIPDFTTNPDTHCPAFYTITSSTIPLKNPVAIASNGTYVYVTDGTSDTLHSGVVLVFDPTVSGSQKPVAALHGARSKLRFPVGIAIGP
jgi:DNA-binding beta-propeller fold protein YncE